MNNPLTEGHKRYYGNTGSVPNVQCLDCKRIYPDDDFNPMILNTCRFCGGNNIIEVGLERRDIILVIDYSKNGRGGL